MYPITNEVKALFEAEQPKVLRITGTDRNGATISITDDNVIADSFQIDRYSCNGEKLEVGTAVAAQMTMTLENGSGTYDAIAFEGAELFAEVGVADWTQANPTIHWVPCGYFTPDEQPRRLSTISITALDRMTKFDVVVDGTNLTFPTTIAGLVGQVCTLCGVTLAQSISGLVNAGVNVAELPTAQEEITYRNIIQWCAGIMGTNAWFDWNGQLRFSWYENATGYVSTTDNRYNSDMYEDDLTVSGVEYANDSGIVIVEGTDDYAIDLTGNAIAGPLVATVLPPLNTALNGFTYRPFTAATVNAPYLWPMDIVTFTDKDGNDHTSALTNVAFGLNGTTAMESKGMTYAINKLAQPKGFTREQAQLVSRAMEHVEQDIDNSLTQQEIFNRLTDDGAAQGIVLYNGQLYINASYINAGYLSADHIQGGTLTLGGQGNQNGVLQVLDASGNVITVLNNAGADITNGSLTTYSTDRQTRTILSDGLLKFQFYNSAAQPIGWRDALRLVADSQSATIGTFAGIAQLNIKGRGRVYISNQDAVTDEKIAELDLDDDLARLHAYTWGEGTTNLDVQGDGLTLTIDNRVGDPFIFHLIEGQSDHPLSIGNGGTGANTAAGARTNLDVPSTTGSGASGTWGIAITGNAATATKATQDGSGNTITSKYVTIDTAQTITGTKSWGTNGAGGQLNGAATNGRINSIKIGDDVWLGDCNSSGIMGMKSTGSNCGFYMYDSSGTQIGKLYFDGTNLVCDKNISANITGNAATATKATQDGNGNNIASTYLPKSGGTMTGVLTMAGLDITLATQNAASDDSSDIVFTYGNGTEKSRIWTANSYTAEIGPRYRVFNKENNHAQIFFGTLALANDAGVVQVPHGGTGATTAANARANLGLYSTKTLTNKSGHVLSLALSPTSASVLSVYMKDSSNNLITGVLCIPYLNTQGNWEVALWTAGTMASYTASNVSLIVNYRSL